MDDQNIESVTFLWPAMSRVTDGIVVVRATGCDGGSRWTGERKVGQESEAFWHWFLENRHQLPPIMNEAFVPGLRSYFQHVSSRDTAAAERLSPPDGVYVFINPASDESRKALGELFERFDEESFIRLTDNHLGNAPLGLLKPFCRGLAEVFCFNAGKCHYFAALAEEVEGRDYHLRKIGECLKQRESK